MLSYKSLFKRLKLRGSSGGSPVSNKLIPPDRTNVKESYAVTKSQDLLCEGPIEGLADRDTRVLRGRSLSKEFSDTGTTHQTSTSAYALKGWGDKKLNKTYSINEDGSTLFKGSIPSVKILLILDQSSSFDGDSVPVADAIKKFVALFRAGPYIDVQFAVYGFCEAGGTHFALSGFTNNYDAVSSTISGATYGGGTEDGMQAIINSAGFASGADEVIIMSDEDTSDPQFFFAALQAAEATGARYHLFCPSSANQGTYRSIVAVTGGFASDKFDPVDAFTQIVLYIITNSRGAQIYSTFDGARFGMSQKEDIFSLLFDGVNWVISNFAGNVTYWTKAVGDKTRASEILLEEGSWTRVSATGAVGEIIDLSTYTIDKGVYFDETPAKGGVTPNFATYKLNLSKGEEDQPEEIILGKNVKLLSIEKELKGPFNGSSGSAQAGNGNSDVRNGRDFASWQNYTPAMKDPIKVIHEVSDKNVDELDITMQITQLNDTQSYSPAGDSKRGRATLGRLQPTFVTVGFKVRTINKDGTESITIPQYTLGRVDGKGFTIQGGGRLRVFGITTSGYEFTLTAKIPAATDDIVSRQIEIEKIESETLSNIINRNIKVRSIGEKNKFTFNYPFSANLSFALDSRSSSTVPNRTYMIKGKRILVPSNYFPTDDYGGDRRFSYDSSTSGEVIYDGIWDGTFKMAWSDNPAWILYDLLINYRYGTAIFNREIDKINIWSLYEISKYCDAVDSDGRFVGLSDGKGGLEPRFSFNHSLKEDRQAFDVIKDIAKSMRALAFYQNSQVQFRVDKPEDPVMAFNNLNVKDGFFNYSDTYKSSRTTAIDVSFLDRDNNYRPRSEHVEDEEAIQKYGYNRQTLQGFGITSRAQALRAGRAALFDSIHATETVSFQVGLEGLFLQPGDIIRVDDELKNLSVNFGKFLGTSGFFYYNYGPGPRALLVDKSLSSVTGDMQPGQEVTIYTPRGTTGVSDLYDLKDQIKVEPAAENSFISDEEISGLKNPQISKFVLDTGPNYIEEFDDYLKFNLDTGHVYNSSEITNFSPSSVVTVNVTGRLERLYRILNVEENEERFYEVGALIHHTGKYDFIEQGVSFDVNLDKFEPGIKANLFDPPTKPSGIATGSPTQNADLSIDLPIFITGSPINGGDEFTAFLTQPNGSENVTPITVDNTGEVVTLNLSDDANLSLTQIGTYNLQVFSRLKNVGLTSSLSQGITFNLGFNDFDFDEGVDSLLRYNNLESEFGFDYNFDTGISPEPSGSGFLAFTGSLSDDVVVDLDIDIRDIFGDDAFTSKQGYDIIQSVDLHSIDGSIIKSGFKTLNNSNTLQITTGELMSGLDYSGKQKFITEPNLKVELSHIQNINIESGILSGQFKGDFEGSVPILFALNKFTGLSENSYDIMPPAVMAVSPTGFEILSHAQSGQDYKFITISTGLHSISGASMQVGFVNKTGTDFERVNYAQDFDTTHQVYVQSQSHGFPVQTYVTGVDTSGFSFNSMDSVHFNKTGLYGFLAIETGSFNVNSGSSTSVDLLNYRNSGSGSQISGFKFGSGINAFLNETTSNGHIANVENAFSIIQPSGGELGETFSMTTDANEAFVIKKDFTSKIFTGISGSGANQFIITPILDELEEGRDIGTGDFSLLFSNYQETELVNDFTIMSKINDSGFRLFTESGNIYLYMKDSAGNSGESMVFESVPTGIVNKFALTVDRDNSSTSYINGKQNTFQTGLKNITGNISIPSTGLKALQSHNSNLVVTPANAYSLYNLNGNPDQYVVDVVDLETENSGSFKASDLIDGTLLNFVGTSGLVAKLYDQFGGKNAYQDDTGLMPFIIANSQLINLDGTPSMVFKSGTRNAFLNIKTDGFGNTAPADMSSFIQGDSGIEVFVQGSFEDARQNTSATSSFRSDYMFGENFNGGIQDFAFGIGSGFSSSSDPRFYLYTERGSSNSFFGFGVDEDTDKTKHGYGYSGELVTLGQKYVMNAFAGFDTVNESGVVGIRNGSSYASGNVITGRNNYIVGTIGSDQTYDNTFRGKLQEILFYTGLQAQREDIYSSIVNRSTRRLDYLVNPFGDQIFLDAIGYTKNILSNVEIASLQSGSLAASNVDEGGIIINLSEGTGEIKDLSISYQAGVTRFTNQISGISKTLTGVQTGSHSGFSFFTIEGTDISTSGSLTKIADAPNYNKTGVFEGGLYSGHDYLSGNADTNRNGQVARMSLSNEYAVMGYPTMTSPQVEIYDLKAKDVLTVITGTDVIAGLPSDHNFGDAVAINNSGDLFISDPNGDNPDGDSNAGHIHYFRESSPGSFTLQQTITGHTGLFNGILPEGTGSPDRKQLGQDSMKTTNSHLFCRYGTQDDDKGHVAAFKITGEGAGRRVAPYGLLSQSGKDGTGDHFVFGTRSGLYFDHQADDNYGQNMAANDNFCLVNSNSTDVDDISGGNRLARGIIDVWSLTGSEPERLYAFSNIEGDSFRANSSTTHTFANADFSINDNNLCVFPTADLGTDDGRIYVYQVESTGQSFVTGLTGVSNAGSQFRNVAMSDGNIFGTHTGGSSDQRPTVLVFSEKNFDLIQTITGQGPEYDNNRYFGSDLASDHGPGLIVSEDSKYLMAITRKFVSMETNEFHFWTNTGVNSKIIL